MALGKGSTLSRKKKKGKEKCHQVSPHKLQLQLCSWSTSISDVKQNWKHGQLVTGIQKEKEITVVHLVEQQLWFLLKKKKKSLAKILFNSILPGCLRALGSWRMPTSSWDDRHVWMATCLWDFAFNCEAKDSKLCFTTADMDECSFSEFLCQHECVNGPGSYYCVCPSGYNLLDDSRSCQGKSIPALIKTQRD